MMIALITTMTIIVRSAIVDTLTYFQIAHFPKFCFCFSLLLFLFLFVLLLLPQFGNAVLMCLLLFRWEEENYEMVSGEKPVLRSHSALRFSL